MTGLHSTLVFLHVSANVVWIGSILAVAIVLISTAGDAVVRGQLAADVYKKLAAPAFGVSFLAGTLRLVLDLDYYFVRTKFMHGKLFLALVVIGLHHVIGARAKKVSKGEAPDGGNVATLAVLLVVAAAGAVFMAVTKPF